jgi:hypothetical protein
MGQKADVVLNLVGSGRSEFSLDISKNRYGAGVPQPPTKFRILDLDDGNLDIETIGAETSPRVDECAAAAVEAIVGGEPLSTRALRAALAEQGFGGVTIDVALGYLPAEKPPRVKVQLMELVAQDGRTRKAKGWTVA